MVKKDQKHPYVIYKQPLTEIECAYPMQSLYKIKIDVRLLVPKMIKANDNISIWSTNSVSNLCQPALGLTFEIKLFLHK